MAFLAQSTIDDLKALAMDLGIEVTNDMTFFNIKDLITKSASYDVNFCKTRLAFIQNKVEEVKAAEVKRVEKERVFDINLFTFESLTFPKSLIVLKICGVGSAACADTGASHSIAGEKLFHILQSKKVKFESKTISVTLADGTQSNVAALTTIVNLEVESKELVVLPEAKGNRTLLGTDFLQSVEIVLDVPDGKWHFCDKLRIQYSFYKVPSNNENCLVADSKEKIAETSSSIQVPKTSSTINLRSDEELKQPNRSKPFRIRTNASSCALGAVLTQGEDPEEHVIEYASRLLIPAEQNFSTTEREALAVVWALEKFRGYVENQEIIIESDHKPLKWLMSIKSPSGRLARWALQIQSTILCRYSPEVETEEAQFVVPVQKRERVLQEYHDVPTAGHYGAEGNYNKVSCRYYFPGMWKYIVEYVKHCQDCNRYKPSNQKSTGLLRTPVYAQRLETLAIDLFGPLPETSSNKKWNFLVEDTSTKWVELFALEEATSVNCAKTLVEEVFVRYGLPRRLISDNGSQFVSAVMQQTCNFLGIKQDLIPVYHPQYNPSERKNRDKKKPDSPHESEQSARLTAEIKDHVEQKQDKRKAYYDRRRRQVFYKPVVTNRSPTTCEIADPAKPDEVLGTYHSSALRAYELPVATNSGIVAPLLRRGRSKKFRADSLPRRRASQRGSL
ncbi:Retrovirus-related Pol polyprotein like [Argiope bruennichi]|uniref:RNA-directed DNA polymerase n=1 Tax=Argiope bruennichi TaxID=94029 RepID=A0A8T0FFB1_ARGBR|nr:Retrovirus-related Pol polyprotein like [Argiope bruennichi]